ncbi:MAG: SDR family oxidoreductase [Kiritimatiellae bacterium]|nr:SDR family oxidoreductase [Kiritimatiellia bacterium]
MSPPVSSLFAPDALDGHVVLLTGATGPIGRATARALAAAGGLLLLHYHAHPDLAEALRAELAPAVLDLLPADLAHPDAPADLVAAASAIAPPTALVNAAARFLPDTAPAADLARMDVLNQIVPAVLLELLAEQGTPFSVINLLDARVVPPFSGPPPRSPYSAYLQTKRVLAASTIRDALRYAPRGIRVNGVAPGPVSLPAGTHAPAGPLPLAGTPRPTPADIASAVLFLLASPQITGQILYVDSGQHLALVP